jgi:hypothetical protein
MADRTDVQTAEVDQSSRSWLLGKPLVALLSQKLARGGRAISPWGYVYFPKIRPRSNWREFQFDFHQIQSAITPHPGLQNALRQWTEISAVLSERSRKRKPQILLLGTSE